MFGLFGPPSKTKFAALVLKKIKASGGPTDFVYWPDSFEIRNGDHRGFLHNIYQVYCQSNRAHRATVLNNFVGVLLSQQSQLTAGFDQVGDQVVTVVRERAFFSSTSLLWRLDGRVTHARQQQEPISEWFSRALVIDAPTHMSFINEDQVREWMQTPDELFALGLNKLKAAKPPAFSEDNGVFKGTWNDDYDSSRILIPGLFDDLPLRGEPVVTIPNRLTLLVAGSDDPAAIKRMLTTAEDIVRNVAKPQNSAPLLVREGKITDYSVDRSSPIYNDVAKAQRLTALIYYQDQKGQLEQLYEKNGKDLFVASYSLHQVENGEYVSHAVLTRDVPTLLPVVDALMLVDPQLPEERRLVGRVEWKRVFEIVPELFLDTEMFPQRFYVSRFPDAEQLKKLLS